MDVRVFVTEYVALVIKEWDHTKYIKQFYGHGSAKIWDFWLDPGPDQERGGFLSFNSTKTLKMSSFFAKM